MQFKITGILILIFFMCNSVIGSQKQLNLNKTDSLQNIKIELIEKRLDSIEKNHSDFQYQKNYFTQALDSQNTIYSMNTTLFAALVTILFGLIGFIVYWRITANFKSSLTSLESNYENIIKSLNKDKASIYTAHMNIMEKLIDKIKYALLSAKYYLISDENEEAIDSLNFLSEEILKKIGNIKYSTIDEFADDYNLLKEIIKINKDSQNDFSVEIEENLSSIKILFEQLNPQYKDE
ncbi:hypothetical protein ACE01N_19600 [Saccharicrinis sp. FJH2]|uniref:hypothetical protein n=1 Tax=Saccharicrinis sp. FJH65 TaxID=3344659 RepID=UPI0035F37AA6